MQKRPRVLGYSNQGCFFKFLSYLSRFLLNSKYADPVWDQDGLHIEGIRACFEFVCYVYRTVQELSKFA